jgi:hypothetical protein
VRSDLLDGRAHRLDVFATSLGLLGPIILCVVVYVRWQLGDAAANGVGLGALPSVSVPPLAAPNGCSFEPGASAGSGERVCVAGVASGEAERAPECIAHRAGQWWRLPGVYVDASSDLAELNRDATLRGELLADRIVHGRFHAGRRLRRGQKGALDVIVVGANLVGISATVRLMQAGLRVLLVDRHSWAPLDTKSHRSLASSPGVARRTRLPLVTGHHVVVVAQRTDGMLELQAERAAWYTANVIFASPISSSVSELASGRDSAPDAIASPRAA